MSLPANIETLDSIKKRDSAVNVSYNKRHIEIPFRFNEIPLGQIVDRMNNMEQEIQSLKGELTKYQRIDINDNSAEKIITDFIQGKKKQGIKEIDIIDISEFTNLPFSQIKKIMNKLKKRGLKEVD